MRTLDLQGASDRLCGTNTGDSWVRSKIAFLGTTKKSFFYLYQVNYILIFTFRALRGSFLIYYSYFRLNDQCHHKVNSTFSDGT